MSKLSDILNQTPDVFPEMNRTISDNAISNKQGEEIVEHPKHYKSRVSESRMNAIISRIDKRGYLEAIDVIDAWNLNFNLGSTMKYVLRLSLKDSEITELEKAIEYLKFEIEMRKADIAK